MIYLDLVLVRSQRLKMLKVMLIGRVGCGKTTLKQRIKNEEVLYDKTQAIEFDDNIIDTPGEYLENRMYMHALLVTSNDADVIILLEDATKDNEVYSFGFAKTFTKPVIGIITKIDLVDSRAIEQAKKRLENAQVDDIYCVGFNEEDQLNSLIEKIQGGVYEKESEYINS